MEGAIAFVRYPQAVVTETLLVVVSNAQQSVKALRYGD
jgi:hypothetical protein